jgi:DNA polymerase III delta subunit
MPTRKPRAGAATPGEAAPASSTGRAPARSSGGRGPASRGRFAGASGASDPLYVLQSLDRGEWPASVYLYGPSEAIKAAFLSELRAAWAAQCPESPSARVFRAAENSVEEVLALYQGVSLFSPRDLILVFEVEDWARGSQRIEALCSGIGAPAGASLLVLVESESDTVRKALEPARAACAVRVHALPPQRRELIAWGERRIAREDFATEPGAIEALVQACEGDPLAFVSELERLVTWSARERRVTKQDVAALQRPVLDADVPGFLAAVAAGHSGIATQRLGRLLAAGTSEGTIVFALSNLVGGALGGWAKYRDASFALRGRLGPARLAHAADQMFRAEFAWKDGRADVVAVLEQATRTIAS